MAASSMMTPWSSSVAWATMGGGGGGRVAQGGDGDVVEGLVWIVVGAAGAGEVGPGGEEACEVGQAQGNVAGGARLERAGVALTDAFLGEVDGELGDGDADGVRALVGEGEGGGEGGEGGEQLGLGLGSCRLGIERGGEGEVVGKGERVVELDALDAELMQEVEVVGGGLERGRPRSSVELAQGVAQGRGGELDVGGVEEAPGRGRGWRRCVEGAPGGCRSRRSRDGEGGVYAVKEGGLGGRARVGQKLVACGAAGAGSRRGWP